MVILINPFKAELEKIEEPETEPGESDPLWDDFLRGSKYGYEFGWTEGAGGNVSTSYGIAPAGTGQIVVNVANPIAGQKGFSFNTTDYYYSINDWANSTIYLDFEGGGTVIPEPATMALLGLGGLGVLLRGRRSKIRRGGRG